MEVPKKSENSWESSEWQSLLSILKGTHRGQGHNSIYKETATRRRGGVRKLETSKMFRNAGNSSGKCCREPSVPMMTYLVCQAVEYKFYHY